MIFFTAMAVGITAGLMRSAFSVAFVAVLIFLTFCLAALLSPGSVSFLPLVSAIAGYNIGLLDLVLAMAVYGRLRTA